MSQGTRRYTGLFILLVVIGACRSNQNLTREEKAYREHLDDLKSEVTVQRTSGYLNLEDTIRSRARIWIATYGKVKLAKDSPDTIETELPSGRAFGYRVYAVHESTLDRFYVEETAGGAFADGFNSRILAEYLVTGATPFPEMLQAREERKNAFFAQYLGDTPFFGILYERLINDHFSIRTGLGLPIFCIPVSASYMTGGTHRFEFSATVVINTFTTPNSLILTNRTMPMLFAGYRIQSPEQGILFRIGLGTLYSFEGRTFFPNGYIATGVSF